MEHSALRALGAGGSRPGSDAPYPEGHAEGHSGAPRPSASQDPGGGDTCFARRGVHATSMDEIIAEAGMSSSTVYRCFPEGKQSLNRAVIDGWVDPVLEWLTAQSQAEQVPSVEEVFVGVVRRSWKIKGIEPTGAPNPLKDVGEWAYS
ncbi:MAG: TetR/AcrR family transcriptional regulator [Propionibacteriaceae bacterium]|nr:TetR/AcrR family transcriptional regulator [Propionibacteriaceae bacterium]